MLTDLYTLSTQSISESLIVEIFFRVSHVVKQTPAKTSCIHQNLNYIQTCMQNLFASFDEHCVGRQIYRQTFEASRVTPEVVRQRIIEARLIGELYAILLIRSTGKRNV